MQTIEETLFANRKTKKKMLQAIINIPLTGNLNQCLLSQVFKWTKDGTDFQGV
jgi:hypothetical protein